MSINNRNRIHFSTKFTLLFSSLIIILITSISNTLINKYKSYYYPSKERDIYQVAKHNDDTIRIAYIGDSWALGHIAHTCIITESLMDSLPNGIKVDSYGIGGLTSKELYNALFEIETFKDFIRKGYDYCFVSAGINDASRKMSTNYYTTSINYIIKFLLKNNIRPIILEIPDYNINKVYEEQDLIKKTIRYISKLVNGLDIDCKQDYRNALNNLITENHYSNKVSVIRYKAWNNNYESNLENLYLKDGLHLNNKGYRVLDSAIVSEILKLNLAYKIKNPKRYDIGTK